jgi:hypothetical protein
VPKALDVDGKVQAHTIAGGNVRLFINNDKTNPQNQLELTVNKQGQLLEVYNVDLNGELPANPLLPDQSHINLLRQVAPHIMKANRSYP